jgi:hypothetical protein
MKTIAVFLLSLLLCVSVCAKSKAQKLEEEARSATGMLLLTNINEIKHALGNDERSDEVMDICTIWNVAKTSNGYLALTAAHCVQLEGISAKAHDGGVDPTFAASYAETSESPVPLAVRIVAVGDENDWSNDVALIEVTTKEKHGVLEIGDSANEPNLDPVIDVSSPAGGYVKSASIGQKAETLAIKGTDNSAWYSLPGTGPGSSGSAILSVKGGKVVEMLNVGNDLGVAGVRGTRLQAFVNAHKGDTASIIVIPKSTVKDEIQIEKWQRHTVRGDSHGTRGDNGNRGRGDRGHDTHGRDGRRLSHDDHRRIDGARDVRFRDGRREVFFGGYWFGCSAWPEWVFVDDVYFELVGDDWFVVEYGRPDIRFAVVFVE